MGETRNPYKILVRKSEDKRPLWRPDGRWKDKIKMENSLHLTEVLCKDGKMER
jgi:hypothetical protein